MGHNEETTSIKGQEDHATLSLITFDKEKLVAMQQQAPEGMTQPRSFQQCLPQRSNQHTKGTSEETSSRSLEEYEVQRRCWKDSTGMPGSTTTEVRIEGPEETGARK